MSHSMRVSPMERKRESRDGRHLSDCEPRRGLSCHLPRRWRSRTTLHIGVRNLLVLALAIAACEPGPIAFVEPGEGDIKVERGVFTVMAKVGPADSALADSLGWQDGVPRAEINLLLNGTAEWTTAFTDSSGTVQFQGLLPGLYRVYGGRVLTDAEAARVGGLVRAFGDGRTLTVGGETELELELFADRPGSLVISEIGNGEPPLQETGLSGYRGGLYFEVYNNSDSTLYLDGKIFGVGHRYFRDFEHTPCSVSEPVRADAYGIHARWLLAFPGGGADFPIGPGDVRIVANQAIDHTPVHSSLFDLSNADFEIGSVGAVNNPAVPDMLDVGLEPFPPSALYATRYVYFLSEPVDIAALPVLFRDNLGREYVRVPKDGLLEVAALTTLWPKSDLSFPPCGLMVHRDFDRYEGGFRELGSGAEADATISPQRKVLRVAPDGRKILQNANTSAVDFFAGTKTPGRLP